MQTRSSRNGSDRRVQEQNEVHLRRRLDERRIALRLCTLRDCSSLGQRGADYIHSGRPVTLLGRRTTPLLAKSSPARTGERES